MSDPMAQYSRSYVEWWNMAGLDVDVADHPKSWLEIENTAEQQFETPNRPGLPKETAVAEVTPAKASLPPEAWPTNVQQLKDDIASARPLPGNMFGGRPVSPVGYEECRLMIISDIPETSDVDAGHFATGPAGKLLTGMINAMGIEIDQCYVTALATTRPAIGDIPDGQSIDLQRFCLHQIDLVKPEAILLLGRATARIFHGENAVDSGKNLHYINQSGGKKAVLATFHPRTLLVQPKLKAQAWKDLQMLLKEDVL